MTLRRLAVAAALVALVIGLPVVLAVNTPPRMHSWLILAGCTLLVLTYGATREYRLMRADLRHVLVLNALLVGQRDNAIARGDSAVARCQTLAAQLDEQKVVRTPTARGSDVAISAESLRLLVGDLDEPDGPA